MITGLCIGITLVLSFFAGDLNLAESSKPHHDGYFVTKGVETKLDTNTERGTEAERVKRQDNFFGVCTQEEYYEWFYNKYPPNCRFLMENLQFEQVRYLVYCDEECGDPYLNYLKSCEEEGEESSEESSVSYYEDLCHENSNGVPCAYYFLAQEKLQPAYYVEMNCNMEFGDAGNSNCSFDCFIALHQFKNQLGCCVNNIYNHTETNMVADFNLWSKCGVSTPGHCSDKGVLIRSSMAVTVILVIMTVVS